MAPRDKEIVVIAVEVHSPKGFGRMRMRRVSDVAGTSLVPFICDVAEKGPEILTDGWGGYNEFMRLNAIGKGEWSLAEGR